NRPFHAPPLRRPPTSAPLIAVAAHSPSRPPLPPNTPSCESVAYRLLAWGGSARGRRGNVQRFDRGGNESRQIHLGGKAHACRRSGYTTAGTCTTTGCARGSSHATNRCNSAASMAVQPTVVARGPAQIWKKMHEPPFLTGAAALQPTITPPLRPAS